MPNNSDPKPHHVLVAVVTTAGTYPSDGFEEVSENQPVRVQLMKAADELNITNTNDWIATAASTDVDVDTSYKANGLQGEIELSYGPRETGGGTRRA